MKKRGRGKVAGLSVVMVKRALKKAKGVVAQAAKELGVSATAVHYWRRHHPEVG